MFRVIFFTTNFFRSVFVLSAFDVVVVVCPCNGMCSSYRFPRFCCVEVVNTLHTETLLVVSDNDTRHRRRRRRRQHYVMSFGGFQTGTSTPTSKSFTRACTNKFDTMYSELELTMRYTEAERR